MENNTPKSNSNKMIGVIIVLVAIGVWYAMSGRTKPEINVADMLGTTASSTNASSTEPTVSGMLASNPSIELLYSVITDKGTYTSNEQIKIFVSIYNNSSTTKTFSFKNGCQGTYTIGDFDLSKHITCTPEPTSFKLKSHETKVASLVHYPSLYQIPAGKYELYAGIVGYSGVTIPVTITSGTK